MELYGEPSARPVFDSLGNPAEVACGIIEVVVKVDLVTGPIVIVWHTWTVVITAISQIAGPKVNAGMPDVSTMGVCPNFAIERRRAVRPNYERGVYHMAVPGSELTPSRHLGIWVDLRKADMVVLCESYTY